MPWTRWGEYWCPPKKEPREREDLSWQNNVIRAKFKVGMFVWTRIRETSPFCKGRIISIDDDGLLMHVKIIYRWKYKRFPKELFDTRHVRFSDVPPPRKKVRTNT